MFDTQREPNSLLQAGQRVRFHPIDRDEYLALGGELDGDFA
jgi:allophanate hydrolase subunit 1